MPEDPQFNFQQFYSALSARGCCIYPGKVSVANCFRIGTIGDLHPHNMEQLLQTIAEVLAPSGNGHKESQEGPAAAPSATHAVAAAAAASAGYGASSRTNGTVSGRGLQAAVPAAAEANGSSSQQVKAVVFDWAGTTIDFGSRAPLMAFLEMFRWVQSFDGLGGQGRGGTHHAC